MLTAFARLALQQRSLVYAKAGPGLHAMLTSAGHEDRRYPEPYDWHGRKRGDAPFALLQYTLAGEGRLRYEGRTMTVRPGQAMVLYFPHDNRYWLPPEGRWRFFYLCLNGAEVMRAWHTAVARLGPVLELSGRDPLLRCAARICRAVLNDAVAGPWEASARAYELAMRLLAKAQAQPAAPRPPRSEGIARVMELVQRQYHRPLSVADLARAAGFSRYHFTRLFLRHEGQSPARYVAQVRLTQAVRLLQTTREPVKVIALRTGFRDPQYFVRAFRRAYGVPPGVFRRSGMYAQPEALVP